jgi:hypothetical protein
MKISDLIAVLLAFVILTGVTTVSVRADTLVKGDFQLESFSKTVDFYDYVRAYALVNGISTPPGFQNDHAYLYMNYINTSGLQLFYAGLENITNGGQGAFRIPMQSFILHYKTNNRSRDVLLSSTFLMLMAFNETSDTKYLGSPDVNDTLWASFSMGFDLSALNATLPMLNSKTEPIPLTHSADNLQWSWGMKYTNLTALWWRTWIDPNNPHFDNSWPIAITVYDELTFTYNLTLDPAAGKATLTENHVIGRMRDLLLGRLPFLWWHFNSTGTYWLGFKTSNDTIYDFLRQNDIKMSIVEFQSSVMADRETYSQTSTGQNVTDTDTPIDDKSVSTYSADGEKISDANFGSKDTYKLFNYTDDPTETTYETFNATARTAKAQGFAANSGLFVYHIGLMKFLPLVVVHMYPQLFQKAMESVTNMSRANYFYLIGYPTYSGYRIEHDPVLTVYMSAPSSTPTSPPFIGAIIVVGAVIAIVVLAMAIVLRRRKSVPPPPMN